MSPEAIRDVLSHAAKRRSTVRVRIGGEVEIMGSIAFVGADVVLLVPRGALRPMQILLHGIEHAEVVTR